MPHPAAILKFEKLQPSGLTGQISGHLLGTLSARDGYGLPNERLLPLPLLSQSIRMG